MWGPRGGLRQESVMRLQPAFAAARVHREPEVIGDRRPGPRSVDSVNVGTVTELGAAARSSVYTLRNEGEARELQGQTIHVDNSGGAVEMERAALHLWRLRAALPERSDGCQGVVALDAAAAAKVDLLRKRLEGQGTTQCLVERLLADVPVRLLRADQQQVPQHRIGS